jgi:CheY-like chemotaxis protein
MTTSDDLTFAQVQEALGVSDRVLKQWIDYGVLHPLRKDGRISYFSRASLWNLTKLHDKLQEPRLETGTPERSLRLLVVDDDPFFLDLFALYADSWPVPVTLTTANNGFEGLVLIGQNRPDVVVSDLCMPGMDGFQMLRRLRGAGAAYANLKFVVVTALSAGDIKDKGGLPSGIEVLFKPVKFEKIQSAVCNATSMQFF